MVMPLALLLAAYLIGSIPFSWIVTRLATGKDLREVGSRNVGATNVARNIGRAPGLVALVLDAAKGFGVVLLARAWTAAPGWPDAPGVAGVASFWVAAAAVTAVLAHMFPVWLGFRGGKGVATAAGVFLAIAPRSLGIAALLFLAVVLSTRFVSLGSMLCSAVMPLLLRFVERETFWIVIASIVIAVAVIAKHHENIARLATGSESRFP